VKLGKLFFVEISILAMVLVALIAIIQVIPEFESSKQSATIGMYNQDEIASGNVTLTTGYRDVVLFNQSSYEPVVMELTLEFQSWETEGNLKLECNGREIASVRATSQNPKLTFTMITFANAEWVKPPSLNSDVYPNVVSFLSEEGGGYEGSFSYKINLRGST
jgi:hypothetical protein